jgi:hypothetical protein
LPVSASSGKVVNINGAALAGGTWENIFSVINA